MPRKLTAQHHVQNGIDYLLIRFGERLQCHKKYYEDGNHLAQMVFRTLDRHSQYSLASFHIGGSFGKKTDVVEPDLDLVVLVNNCHPPLKDVLKDFKNILKTNRNTLQIHSDSFKKTELSLHFNFINGISVDLLPSANIKKNEMRNVFKEMNLHHKYAYFYNPSFVEHQVAFMKSQDSFTHTLVRLSKFWLKSLDLGESFRGGSAMMELIVVAAVESERGCEKISALRVFLRVLDTVMNLQSTKLAFWHYVCDKNLEKWTRISQEDLSNNNANGVVPLFVGKYDILQRKCFIIDPANPFRDYLEDKTDSVIKTLNGFAQITLHRLEQILNGHGIYDQEIQDLFRPIPDIMTSDKNQAVYFPKNILVTYDEICMSVHNEVTLRDRSVKQSKEAWRAVKILKNNMLTVIQSTVEGKLMDVSVFDVKNAVLKVVESNTKICIKFTDSYIDHNSPLYDVMIRIPYVINETGYAVCASMTWEPNFPEGQGPSPADHQHVSFINRKSDQSPPVIWFFIVVLFVTYYYYYVR